MRKIRGRKGRKKEIGVAAVIVAAIFGLMLYLAPWKTQTNPPKADSVGQVDQTRRLLDGVMVEEGKEKPPMAGVMVENMDEAQPISGIADANLVFEAVTEANVTRFLALYTLEDGRDVPEIGPVRSARPYFLDWAAEFDTLYGHVGSSPAAYEMLRPVRSRARAEGASPSGTAGAATSNGIEGVHDLDQWYKDEYYFKKNGRPRPHHFYTSFELLRKAHDLVKPPQQFSAWKFKNDAPPDLRGNVGEIKVGYGGKYAVTWLYDKAENHYKRLQWGGAHKDASGKEVIAKNIAVAFSEMKVLDGVGRKEFKTIGEGKGLVFQDGRVVVGTWKKPTPRERMRFFDVQGGEVEFNAAVTWVEIVPKSYRVTY